MNRQQRLIPRALHLSTSLIRLVVPPAVGLALLFAGDIDQVIGQESTSPQSTFLGRLDVNIVNVEVFVTDKKGQPLLDLSQKDFEIFEDGDKVKLTNFRAPDEWQSEVDPANGNEKAADRHVAILVDNLSIHPGNRVRVLRNLEQFIRQNGAENASFLVASYDGHLSIRQPFTNDLDLILSAISGLQELSPLGISRYAQREALLRDGLQELRGVQEAERMVDEDSSLRERSDVARLLGNHTKQVDLYAMRVDEQTRGLLFEMSHLVNALAVVPGRKSLVFVSEGIPMRPAAEMYQAIQRIFSDLESDLADSGEPDPDDEGLSAKSAALSAIEARGGTRRSASGSNRKKSKNAPADGFQQIAALANSSRVSFYTIKAQGNLGGVEAEYGGDIASLLTPDLKRVRESNLTESLRVLAGNTGGLSDIGFDAGGLIEKARKDLSSHYSLGYSPDHLGDSQYHRIKVKVKRKGAVLRYREGYIDKPLDAKLADRVSASFLLGLDDNPLGISFSTYPARRSDSNRQWIVPIEVLIPIETLTLLPQGPLLVSEGQIFVAAVDSSGNTAPVQGYDLRIEIPATDIDVARDQMHRARFELQMRQGSQRLAIGFYEPASNAASFVGLKTFVGSGEN
jgi:VWFA-related protein